MRKFLLILLVIFTVILFVLGTYKVIEFLEYRSSIANLEKHTLLSNEKIVKSFKYNKYDYVITMYHEDTSSWSHLNILLKDNQDYYILENIKKCDTVENGANLYVENNEIYIHCIGKEGNIDKYVINDLNIDKRVLIFNYSNTPNISEIHIVIDRVDDEHIYLSSPFKVDNTILDDSKVKCSLKDKMCHYY